MSKDYLRLVTDMDWPEDLQCLCGKVFAQPSALANHRNACSKAKEQVTGALQKAKLLWEKKQEAREQRKRQKIETLAEATSKEPATSGAIEPGQSYDSLMVPGDDNSETPGESSETVQTNANASVNEEDESLNLPIAIRRTRRNQQKPLPHKNVPPQKHTSLPASGSSISLPECENSHAQVAGVPSPTFAEQPKSCQPQVLESSRNAFGFFRRYHGESFPNHDPDEETTSDDLSDLPDTSSQAPSDGLEDGQFWPYPNRSSFLLSDWYWNTGAQKSRDNLQKLIDIISDDTFQVQDIKDISWASFNGESGTPPPESSVMDLTGEWAQKEVRITVPFRRSANTGCTGPKEFVVGNFYCRSIIEVMRERISGPDGCYFHYEPYDLFWQPGTNSDPSSSSQAPHRVYGELYTSPAFVEAHIALQESPREQGCTLPRVVVALMFASDETHLSQFGETKLWPLYLQFGNESKYRRCKPSLHLCNHVAYLIKLPETFKEFVHANTNAKSASTSLAAHCLREALHTQLSLVLDDDFLHAHDHGVVFTCFDGQDRRFHPRVFTFSNDYKDKVVWSGIRNLGAKPCPRCLIPLEVVHNMGMKRDTWWRTRRARKDDTEYRNKISRARSSILEGNYALHGKHVDTILKDQSLVAVSNALSTCLSSRGFDLFSSMVVDFMHEIESGNWRSLFIHLLRILDCAGGGSLISELDSRYRQIPSFGLDTIRKFRRNCSEMKNLAARDWEDMLQCAIPAFEGLLATRFNSQLCRLLFTFAHWHALAKLRLHTDATLDLLSELTTELGNRLRSFQTQSSEAFDTRELQKEAAARRRRTEAAAKKAQERANATSLAGRGHLGQQGCHLKQATISEEASPEDVGSSSAEPTKTGGRYERRPKTLNLNTYKFHAMGDYVATIRRYGTVDSYSTEISELEHRRSKARYSRTSKKDFLKQLAQIERRQAQLKRIRERTKVKVSRANRRRPNNSTPPKSLELPYWVAESQNSPIHLFKFMKDNAGDPAAKGFISKLKAHLEPRARALFNNKNADSTSLSFFFQRDRMYEHKRIQINYTTYDVRRSQDSINPNTSQHNVMLLASPNGSANTSEEQHPYLYARVIKIFHVNVICTDQGTEGKPQRLDVLWVRWYERIASNNLFELDRLEFPPVNSEAALGFVDPCDVLRACHIVPRFSQERQFKDGVGTSRLAKDSTDWREYYVNRFVDRDMLMRYHWGLGIGHQYSWSSQMEWKWGLGFGVSEAASDVTREGDNHPTGPLTSPNHPIQDNDDNSSDGDLGLRDRENEDLGSEHSSDDDAWEDDLERARGETDSEAEGDFNDFNTM